MKLRNKKTGEIGEAYWATFREGGTDLCISMHKNAAFVEVHSLAELNEEWEDYKPTEPLINNIPKDEKIRKAVRAWAEALDIDEVYINYIGDNTYIELYEDPARNGGWNRMSLPNQEEIKKNERYTIAELCGEEEE